MVDTLYGETTEESGSRYTMLARSRNPEDRAYYIQRLAHDLRAVLEARGEHRMANEARQIENLAVHLATNLDYVHGAHSRNARMRRE